MTNQNAIGFVTSDELHELCQGISARLEKLIRFRADAAAAGNAENVKYWEDCIEIAKSAQRKLLLAYSV